MVQVGVNIAVAVEGIKLSSFNDEESLMGQYFEIFSVVGDVYKLGEFVYWEQ
jgi:hypothetical protein